MRFFFFKCAGRVVNTPEGPKLYQVYCTILPCIVHGDTDSTQRSRRKEFVHAADGNISISQKRGNMKNRQFLTEISRKLVLLEKDTRDSERGNLPYYTYV